MRSTYALLLVSTLVGCNPPQQKAWLYKMLQAGSEVEDSERYYGRPISTSRLIEIAGQPDVRIAAESLPQKIESEQDYQLYVRSEIEQAFGRHKRNMAHHDMQDQGGPGSFSECVIWLYDESNRFPQPYKTSADAGYSVYFFLVWEYRVIGAGCAHHWPGIAEPMGGHKHKKVPRNRSG